MIINFTGQPESSKTTLSKLLRTRLRLGYPSYQVVILDGDVIRKATNNTDYSEAGRRKNISAAYDIARSLKAASQIDTTFKVIIIIALISPYKDLREELKSRGDVLEFYLTSYRNSRAQYNVANYERPTAPFIFINTDHSPEFCMLQLMTIIVNSNLLPTHFD